MLIEDLNKSTIALEGEILELKNQVAKIRQNIENKEMILRIKLKNNWNNLR